MHLHDFDEFWKRYALGRGSNIVILNSRFQDINYIIYTGGTVRAKKLSLKSLALSGLFGAKWFGPNCTTGVVIMDNR